MMLYDFSSTMARTYTIMALSNGNVIKRGNNSYS